MASRYGAAVCLDVTQFVGDDERLLRDLWRVLLPGGVMIASFVNSAGQRLDEPTHVSHRSALEVNQIAGTLTHLTFKTVLGQREDGTFVRRNVGPFLLLIVQKDSGSGQPSFFERRLARALNS